MAIHVMGNFVPVDEYAAMCEVTRRTILNRIKSKTISAMKVDGFLAVNTVANPPRKFLHHKWGRKGGGKHVQHEELRAVIPWCWRKEIRCYPFLRAIITGKIDGWVIAGEVFAKASDLEEFRHRKPAPAVSKSPSPKPFRFAWAKVKPPQ